MPLDSAGSSWVGIRIGDRVRGMAGQGLEAVGRCAGAGVAAGRDGTVLGGGGESYLSGGFDSRMVSFEVLRRESLNVEKN